MRFATYRQAPALSARPRSSALRSQRLGGARARPYRAAACAGISAGLGAFTVFAIGRFSAGEQFIIWVLLIGWLAYWLFDRL